MLRSPKRQWWMPACVVLTLATCTLTEDSYQPVEVVGPLGTQDVGAPADAGSASPVPPPAPVDAGRSDTCPGGSESLECEIALDTPALPSAGCAADSECDSSNCRDGNCQAATCEDGILNQGERSTDCAGPCAARCAAGQACGADVDCDSGLRCPDDTQVCTPISCQDGIRDGAEILADCGGGVCPGCPVGTPCNTGDDCVTEVCRAGLCVAATCSDGAKNQDETDTDCGGGCGDCGTGAACGTAQDCQSRVCDVQGCAPGLLRCCQAPSCADAVANGTESSADCGNAACGPCPLGRSCTADRQCSSGFCQEGACRIQPCADGDRNGTETDVDCGGGNADCARCALGRSCVNDTDCGAGACLTGVCADCADQARNGTETAVDCGGVCPSCAPGEACRADADCQSGACQDGRCCGGASVDCTRCARRLATVISCATNGIAAQPDCDAFLQCLSDNSEICSVRSAPGCSEDPGGVCDHVRFGGNGGPGLALADAILGTARCTF
jgi:hypothetical protein